CRMGLSINIFHGWHLTATLGSFGSAISASKILGLDKEKMFNAFGISYSQACGHRQASRDGALTKRMQPAFNAKAGVLSAYLADHGIVGTQNTLEGKYGYFNLYERGRYSRERLIEGLGEKFEIVNLSLKPYPCCRLTHPSIEATLNILGEHHVEPSDIEEVVIRMPRMPFEIVGRPFELRANTQVSAQFSVPYTVAAAIMNRDVELADFDEENVLKEEVIEFAKNRVRILLDERFQDSRSFTPVRVEIVMKGGDVYCEEIEVSKGNPQKPMSYGEVGDKFLKCSKYCAKKLPEKNLEKIVELLNRLEEVDDVGLIPRLLSPQS
ncbi:MAG: MmgE/PrpD family protein, partial [Deltaproteobacteria bacterium]|nr:MmgE/PrpD family protein [Deltaproteobacteria bacterium]